jgi:hypothetical protein
MVKSRKLEALLETLTEIQSQPLTHDSIAQLSQILRSNHAVAVARAAQIIGKQECHTLIPDLTATFDRLMVNPANTDPNCIGKVAIADALYRLGSGDASLFLRGIHHTQMEAVWGGTVDTAAELRGICGLALVRLNYADVLIELADLLADPEAAARSAAARAIAYSGDRQGVALLRLRIKIGDEPQVISDYVSALLALDIERSLDIATQLLQTGSPATQELVALALGESYCSEAFDILQQWWKHTSNRDLRNTALLAIATLRTDDAIQFLLAVLREGAEADVKGAIAALRIYQQNPTIWQQVQEIITDRNQSGSFTIQIT